MPPQQGKQPDLVFPGVQQKLHLVGGEDEDVREGEKLIRKCKGIEYIGEGSGQVVLKLLPGSYSFEVKKEYPMAGKKRKKGEIARSKGTH